jgi:hypothetical protein
MMMMRIIISVFFTDIGLGGGARTCVHSLAPHASIEGDACMHACKRTSRLMHACALACAGWENPWGDAHAWMHAWMHGARACMWMHACMHACVAHIGANHQPATLRKYKKGDNNK